MAEVTLKYHTEGLAVRLPDTPNFLGVLEPRKQPSLIDPERAVVESLAHPIDAEPLRRIATGRKNAVIVISDVTRPVPNTLLLPPILDALHTAGLPPESVTILIATGIHRPNVDGELTYLVGEEIASTYRIENHYAKRDDAMVRVGTIMNETPVYVNRRYVESDLKILTGFIEPHMWAGYSGGRKAILPGISSVRTVEFMHGPEMIDDPNVVYGKLAGNPFHEAALMIMESVGADFIVNVTLDTSKRVTGVYSGHPVTAHLHGCSALEPFSTTYLDKPLDFVVTTTAGFPLDVNLYQTAKGIAGVAPVVKEGGAILVASHCTEGLGSDEFVRSLDEFTTPAEWIQRALNHEFFYPDQWCAQEIYKWMRDHDIYLYSDGVSDDEQRKYGLRPIHSISDTVEQMLKKEGQDAIWAVIPDGPHLVLRLK